MSAPPTFFANPDDFRTWLETHHAKEQELLVGYYKKATGKPSITWEESVEEALCFGWIDGIRRRVDEEAYTVRFTPRRPNSNWSRKNVATVERLLKEQRMQPAGIQAYEARSGLYSYEQEQEIELSPSLLKQFKHNEAAWDFFQAQPPSYRRLMTHWVASAKQEATQLRRLERVIAVSAQKKRVDISSPFKKTI